jgi:hypothetical protein
MPRVGPRGLEFARARLEMKAAETILHLRREEPAKIKKMAPEHVWILAKPYGLEPEKAKNLTLRQPYSAAKTALMFSSSGTDVSVKTPPTSSPFRP